MSFEDFRSISQIFMDFYGLLAGWLAGWVTEQLGLLGLFGWLEGVIGLLALLEGSLVQRCSNTLDAQEMSADSSIYEFPARW